MRNGHRRTESLKRQEGKEQSEVGGKLRGNSFTEFKGKESLKKTK